MRKEAFPIINYNLCTRCGVCITGCPEDALLMTSKGPELKGPALCTYCTECENICPTGAIRTPLTITWRTNTNP